MSHQDPRKIVSQSLGGEFAEGCLLYGKGFSASCAGMVQVRKLESYRDKNKTTAGKGKVNRLHFPLKVNVT